VRTMPSSRKGVTILEALLALTIIAAAMSIEALLGNLKPYNATLHVLRGFAGARVYGRGSRQSTRDGPRACAGGLVEHEVAGIPRDRGPVATRPAASA
jgi:hypothetical protein